jgi:hypothetical protein
MKGRDCTAANYSVAIEVTKPARDVFNHLINDVSKFWPEEFEGKSAQLNDEFVFRSGDSHYSKNRVVELVPNKKLVWLVTESIRKTDNFEWTGTRMIFDLTNKGDGTLLKFTYDGLTLESEYDRLVQVCDMVIKENLNNLLTDGNKNYKAVIELAKSPEFVFNCLKEVSKWWNREDFEGDSSKPDDEFVICHPGRHYSKQKLIEVVPNEKVVWLVTDSKLDWLEKDQNEWTNTKMIFEITTRGDLTVLHFTHEGLVPQKECYEMCERGWNMVIKERLFSFITLGKTI